MAAAVVSAVRKLFKRKKPAPLVCSVELDLDNDETHVHTAACFIDFEPLALVEFFMSQGCEACPQAIPGIQEATNHPNLLLLTYNVSIFDHLGWKDTHASAAWDGRQRAYVRRWGRTRLFTPMVVANGLADGAGIGDGQLVKDVVARAREIAGNAGKHVYVDANDTDVRIDSDMESVPTPYDIFVAVYDPQEEKVKVQKGPNKGKKLVHKNVVRELNKIGEWSGGTIVVPFPMARSAMDPALEAVVFVQDPNGGAIVGSAKLY